MNDHRLPIPQPPAQIAPFVQVLGLELTVAFLLRFGGAELHLSEDPRANSQLVALVGLENARALGQLLTVPRRIPLAKPWLAAWLRARGESTAEISRTLHVSDVTVRGWLKARDATPNLRPTTAKDRF